MNVMGLSPQSCQLLVARDQRQQVENLTKSMHIELQRETLWFLLCRKSQEVVGAYICMFVHMERPEDNVSCHSTGVLTLFFETGSITGTQGSTIRQAGTSLSPQHCTFMPGFLHGCWGLNSGPRVCKASASLTKLNLTKQPFLGWSGDNTGIETRYSTLDP